MSVGVLILLRTRVYSIDFFFQYMFVTEVDSSKKKAVHDELARLLVQYLRQQNGSTKLKLLDVSHGGWS